MDKPRDREDDLDREIRAHLDSEAEEQRQSGLNSADAESAARRAFGSTARIKEEVREMWSGIIIEQIAQEIRYALRGLQRNKALSIVAILSLACGIGAAITIFRVLNAVILRPLDVHEPDRLVLLQPELRGKRYVLFNPVLEELMAEQTSLSGAFAVSNDPYMKAAIGDELPTYYRGALVSGSYFEVLGIGAAIGRIITPADDSPDAEPCAAVISHTFSMDRFQGSPLGQRIRVRDKDCVVAGVAPRGFKGHQAGFAPDIWVPIGPHTRRSLLASRSMGFFSGVVARLAPGVSLASAEAELNAKYQRIYTDKPAEAGPRDKHPPRPEDYRMRLKPGAQGLDALRREFEQSLWLVMAVVVTVLLIAGVNVANLLLSRGAARSAEFATRAALGASRMRILRQVFIEGTLLSVAGGLFGLALSALAAPVIAGGMSLGYMPVALDTGTDRRVLGMAIGATLLCAILAGAIPALRLSSRGLQSYLSHAGRATASRPGLTLSRALVATQLALSLVLVSAAGLMGKTIARISSVDPGFDPHNVLLMSVRDTTPDPQQDPAKAKEDRLRRYSELERRLSEIPGVKAAAISWLGLFGGNYVGVNVQETGRPETQKFVLTDYVSSGYFASTGMQILRGRGFTPNDREGAPRVAVVNEAFVRERIDGNRDGLGVQFFANYAEDLRPFVIVGVLRDAKYNDLREKQTEPMLWLPLAQSPVPMSSITLRTEPGASAAIARMVETALKATSPHFMVQRVTTLRSQVDRTTTRERLLLKLSFSFGSLALALAAVGLYGTIAYSVTRRTREIGIRLALGAQPKAVRRMILVDSLRLFAAGAWVGMPLSIGAGYALRSFLFGVTPYDPTALSGACLVLAASAVAAGLLPARRASRVDPVSALKYE